MRINIIEYWLETVGSSPNGIAVIDGEKRVEFGQLDSFAKKIANKIVDITKVTNKPICVFAPKSVVSIASDIAILYSGNYYLNLDVRAPKDRIIEIIRKIGPSLLIVDSITRQLLKDSESYINCLLLEVSIDEMNEIGEDCIDSSNLPFLSLIDTDPMCIITTSGSTGIPKGVVLNHRSFIDYLEWAVGTFGFSSSDKIGSLAPIVFDHFSYELILMMSKGSSLLLIPEKVAGFPSELLQIIKDEAVTYIFWVPTIMVNISNLNLLESIKLPALRTIWFAGEIFPTKHYNYWKKNITQASFTNLYGPTEITVDCTYYTVDREIDDNEPIPIGHACRNTDILVLSEDMKTITVPYQEGELCVRGTSLSMGYYNDPEMTSKSFIQNPLNQHYPEIIYRTGDFVAWDDRGELIFKGRRDTMIKHSGYRIELSEIEHAAVNKAKIVQNAFVTYRPQDKTIVMAYESPEEIDIATLRSALSLYIPKYMLPNQFVHFKSFPMNTNGKIDRLSLARQLSIPVSL